MTPAAITPAGRSTTKRAKPTATPRSGAPRAASARTTAPPKPARIVNPASTPWVPGHRRRLRPQATPKVPRRVSGPARGRSARIPLPLPGQGGGLALPRPGRGAITKPRSRPGRDATRPQLPPLPRRLLGAVRALPDHSLLDRVVRGRTWIAVLGVMLAGIVAMQIEVLKLGASIGRSLQRGTSLQSRNEQLRASVAQLGDDQRIERLAATMGMVMPAAGGVGFLSVGSGKVQKAIANLHQPNPQAFLSLSVPNGAVTGGSSVSGTPGAGGATTGSTTSAPTTPSSTATTGTASPAGGSGQTAQAPAAATSAPASTTQPTPPASTAPAQTTSPTSPSTGTAGAATPAPTQSSSPTAATGGAGVPAAG